MNKLVALSYNIHKGFSSGIKKFTLDRIRDELRSLDPDLIFVQEIHGEHSKHEKIISGWPEQPQFDYLAHEIWPHVSYGKNAIYANGHHGNAILSKYPILSFDNIDLSLNPLEKRGLLHAQIKLPSPSVPLNIFCTHLNLFEKGRERQLLQLSKYIQTSLPKETPLILAGDFNDWRQSANSLLKKQIGVDEAFVSLYGRSPASFPSFKPFLRLDRIYYRGLQLVGAHRLRANPWPSLSDHLPIMAEFILP